MPLDLNDLLDRAADLAVPYGDAVVNVTYRPEAVTGDTQRVVHGLTRSSDADPLFAELARVLIAWDVTRGGVPVPLTVDGIASVGLGVTGAVLGAVLADAGNPTHRAARTRRVPPGSPTPSSNGSSSPTSSAPAPAVTSSSSPPPNGPASHPGPSWGSTTPQPLSVGSAGSPASGGP